MHSNHRRGRWGCAAIVLCLAVAFAPATTLAKTTTWTHASPSTDLWSDPLNWDNGIPSFFDVVHFAPVGGDSHQDIPGLGLDTIDMTGFTGALMFDEPVDVAGDFIAAGAVEAGWKTFHIGGNFEVGADFFVPESFFDVGQDLIITNYLHAEEASLVVSGSVEVTGGTLDLGNGTLEVGGNLTVDPLGSATWTAPAGTLRFNGSGAQTWSDRSPGSSYGNVEIDTGAAGRVVVPPSLPVLDIGGELVVTSGTLEVGSDLIVGSPTVVQFGAGLELPATAANPEIEFHATFSLEGDLTVSSDGGTLRFATGPGNGVVAGANSKFEVHGTPLNQIHLVNDGVAGGDQWYFDHPGVPGPTLTFDNVYVQDSNASNGNTVTATSSTDGGNNDNWDFGGAHTITGWMGGGPTTLWSDAANWTDHVPMSGDTVFFMPVGGPSDMDIAGLVLARMDMTGFTGTVTLGHPLGADEVTTGGVLNVAGTRLDVTGDVAVGGGTLDLAGGSCNVGGGLHVAGGHLVAHGGTLAVTGTVSGTAGAELDFAPGVMSVRDTVDCSDFTGVSFYPGGSFTAGGSHSYVVDFGPGKQFDELALDLDDDSLTIIIPRKKAPPDTCSVRLLGVRRGTLDFDVPALEVTGDLDVDAGGRITRVGGGIDIGIGGFVHLAGSFEFKKSGSTITPKNGIVIGATGSLELGGDNSRLRIGPRDTVLVYPGGTFVVETDSANARAGLVLDATPGSDQWILDIRPGASTTFNNVRVEDCDASPGETAVATGNSLDGGNNTHWIFTFTGIGGDTPLLPLSVRAVPNPFNPHTMIHYSVPRAGPVTIRIYDVAGRLVRSVLSEVREAGAYAVPWDGRDNSGGRVSSGVYFCSVESGGKAVAKLVLLR